MNLNGQMKEYIEELVEQIEAILREDEIDEDMINETYKPGEYLCIDIDENKKKKKYVTLDYNNAIKHQNVFKCVSKGQFRVYRYKGRYIDDDTRENINDIPFKKKSSLKNFCNSTAKTVTEIEKKINSGYHEYGSGIKIGNFTIVGSTATGGTILDNIGNEKKIDGDIYSRIYNTFKGTSSEHKEKIEKVKGANTIEDFLKYFPDRENSKTQTIKRKLIKNILKFGIDYTQQELDTKDTIELERILSDEKEKYEMRNKTDLSNFIQSDTETVSELCSIYQKIDSPYIIEKNKVYFPAIDRILKISEEQKKYLSEIENDKVYSKTFYSEFDESKEQFNESKEGDNQNLNIYNDDMDPGAWQKEKDVAGALNNICNQMNKYDKINNVKGFKFYSGVVGGSSYSDVLVVKDKKKFSDKSRDDNKPEIQTNDGVKLEKNMRHLQDGDKYFYIEVKKDYETASYFKFKLRMSFLGDKCKKLEIGRAERGHINSINEELYEELKNEFQTDESLKGIFVNLKKNINLLFNELNQIKTIKNRFKDIIEIKDNFTLPDDVKSLSQIFNFYIIEWTKKFSILKATYIYDKLIGNEEELTHIIKVANNIRSKVKTLSKCDINDMNGILNKNYLKKFNDIFSFITTKQTFVDSEFIGSKDKKINNIYELINRYYADDKDVRYIEIGDDVYLLNPSDTEEHIGKTQKKYGNNIKVMGENPLGLKDVKNFKDIKNAKHKVRVYCAPDGSLYLNIFIEKQKSLKNGFERKNLKDVKNSEFFNTGDSMENVDKKTSKNENEELTERINEILNESFENENLEEGMETSKTEANKFELEVTDSLKKFLRVQKSPYNSLEVEHYEEPDLKYWSDIKVTNPKNNKRFWVEAKENKYSCLGSTSMVFKEGKWTCSTLEDNDPLVNDLLNSINENSKEFVQFCKEYLGTEDITLPKDITEDLVEAWRNSGKITDTDNTVLFITNKIPLENFGEKIASFYKNSKNEPAYYIQIGDDLYLVDKNTNVLNLRTKDGNELKTLSQVYKLGRIQFRLKRYNRPQKIYYSIYEDVKILADEDNVIEDYNCSFLSQEKWPVIVENTKEVPTEKTQEMQVDTDEQEITEQFENICQEDSVDDVISDMKKNKSTNEQNPDTKTIKNVSGSEILTLVSSLDGRLILINTEGETIRRDDGQQLYFDDKMDAVKWTEERNYKIDSSIEDEGLQESEQNDVKNFKLLTNVPEDNIRNILDTTKIENKRFEKEQFEKYYGQNYSWACLMNGEECLAMACLKEDEPFKSYVYIAEIQTLKKGYGRYLIEELINKYGKVWLMANTKAGESLINYYRNLNLQEITVENSVYGCTAYFFCTKDCDYDKLENYLIAFYSNEEEELDESENSNREYAWHVSNVPPEIIKKEGFVSGKGNGATYENLLGDDFYEEFYPSNYLFVSKEPWDDSREGKFRYAYKIDITGLNLYPDFGMFKEYGCEFQENNGDRGGYDFWFGDYELGRIKNANFRNFVEREQNYDEEEVINTHTMLDGETSEGKDFSEELYKYLGSAVVDGDVVNDENRIVDVVTRDEVKEAEEDIGGEKSDLANVVHGDKIWIDDIRQAPEGFKWFKTVRQFIKYIDEHGTDNIALIDTDHDAGDYQKFGGDYIRCIDYLDYIGAKNVTIHIHSANPVGANNIRRIISKNKEENNWKEVRNTNEEAGNEENGRTEEIVATNTLLANSKKENIV